MNHIFAHRLRTLSVEKLFRLGKRIATHAVHMCLFPVAYCVAWMFAKWTGKTYLFASVNVASIGGWALQLDAFLRRTQAHSKNIRYIFVAGYADPINPYFFELMKRHVTVIEEPLLKFLLMPLVRIPNPLQFFDQLECLTPEEIGKYPKIDWFNAQDHIRGRELLKSLGIEGDDSWYVCFFARDNAYNENYNSNDELNYNLTYHSTRNSDIDTYIDSMRYILDRGGYVIRMGMIAGKAVGYQHPHLIDYPFCHHKSDFADVYLMCHGKFVIGSGSGVVDLSSIVDMPLGCVNGNLFWLGYERENMIYIPKLIKSAVTETLLTISKYHQLFSPSVGADNIIVHNRIMKINHLEYVDNSADDILLVTKAMHQKFVETNEGFKTLCGRSGQIWPEFLKRYPQLLDDIQSTASN